VRRAAVMTVVPVPHMVAGPPTPPPSDSASDGGADDSDYVSGDDFEYDAVADADAGNVGEKEVGNAGAGTSRGNTEHLLPPASVPSTAPVVAAHGSPGGETSTGALPVAQAPVNAEAFAQQLADNGRNPRVLTAALWMPGAQAVLAAAQAPHAGLPPIPPPGARRAVPVSATARLTAERTSSPSRSFPATQPPMADAEDGSSSDMDDDALVEDYITPPASPLPSTAAASPRRTRPLSTKRRRSIETRTACAAAGAAFPVNGEIEPVSLALHDVHEALRNGFAFVRRELTRLRAELVVVKSQSASTLRRIDGIAAAADGRESGSGVFLERLKVLDRAVHSLGERLPLTGGGATGGGGAPKNSVELMAEMKVLYLLARRPWSRVLCAWRSSLPARHG